MTPDDLAERFAYDKQGFELVSYALVGLPYWRMRVRCEVLARKAIATIDEMVLRAVSAGVTQADELMMLLGVDPQVLDGAVVGMLGSEWLRQTGDDALAVTDIGREIEDEAAQVRSEDRSIMFDYDGLLRRPTLVDRPLEPSELAKTGAREIPAHPVRRPDELELRDRALELEAFVRRIGDGRDQEADLLAVKEVKRRERIFREALALVYRAESGRDVQVAFVIDEEISPDHGAAFAKAGLAKRLGVDRIGRRTRVAAGAIDPGLEGAAEPEREAAIRSRIHVARGALELDEADEQARADLLEARGELRDLPVRGVAAYEQLALLRLALRGSRERLLIVSPRIRSACVGDELLSAIRRLLDAGGEVRIGYGASRRQSSEPEQEAVGALRQLEGSYERLHVVRFPRVSFGRLISDSSYLAVTGFNWFAWRGDNERMCRDERGMLVTDAAAIEAAWRETDDDFLGTADERSAAAGSSSPAAR